MSERKRANMTMRFIPEQGIWTNTINKVPVSVEDEKYNERCRNTFFFQWPQSAIDEVNKLVSINKLSFEEARKIVSENLVRS